MKDFFARQNLHVETACDGKVGFSMALTGDYDLITLDLRMPMLNGVESMRSIKTVNPDQEIIIISGYLNDDIRAELATAGINTILTKPVNLAELLKIVKEKLNI
jgi:DNA-binding response OmpR family regulator